MAQKYIKFFGKHDRRNPRNFGEDKGEVWLRENFLARDLRLQHPQGTVRLVSGLTDICTWEGRYHTVEVGQISPKTFAYTKDGKLWYVNEQAKTATEIKSGLNLNAYPKHWIFKIGDQSFLYFVDGRNLYKYDGNNNNEFQKVDVEDADGNPVNPIDIIEHNDRLVLISKLCVFISKNFEPDTYDDATDSIEIIVGSGQGQNLSLGKIQGMNTLFILNTEGIYALQGDVISAVASTFEVNLVDSQRIIAGRSCVNCEGYLYFLADDLNVYRFNGGSSEKLSHYAKLEDFVNPYRDYLDMAVATYEDRYYKLSFVESGNHKNTLEYWYDTIDDRDDFVRGRNVSCYMRTDPTVEMEFKLIGRSDQPVICYADRGENFDNSAIRSKLWTKDITLAKNWNSRISNFYIDLETTGDFNLTIYYALDGRQDPNKVGFAQNLEGEYSTAALFTGIGTIHLSNQSQFTDRAKPQIKYAKGETIAFYIDEAQLNQNIILKGITVEYEKTELKHSKKVGA